MNPKIPPQWVLNRIEECLSYDPVSGDLFWSNPISRRMKPGDLAGSVNTDGYTHVGFSKKGHGKKFVDAHHIAWYKYYGCWPQMPVDHIENEEPVKKNSITNLRLGSLSDNQFNRGAQKNNKTTGQKNISFDKRRKKFRVEIQEHRRKIFVGYFESIEEAIQARNDKLQYYHGRFMRW